MGRVSDYSGLITLGMTTFDLPPGVTAYIVPPDGALTSIPLLPVEYPKPIGPPELWVDQVHDAVGGVG